MYILHNTRIPLWDIGCLRVYVLRGGVYVTALCRLKLHTLTTRKSGRKSINYFQQVPYIAVHCDTIKIRTSIRLIISRQIMTSCVQDLATYMTFKLIISVRSTYILQGSPLICTCKTSTDASFDALVDGTVL